MHMTGAERLRTPCRIRYVHLVCLATVDIAGSCSTGFCFRVAHHRPDENAPISYLALPSQPHRFPSIAGADDFLPVLIYVVIHANPPQLASNLLYIERFRMHSRMQSESAYFFTQLVRAAGSSKRCAVARFCSAPQWYLRCGAMDNHGVSANDGVRFCTREAGHRRTSGARFGKLCTQSLLVRTQYSAASFVETINAGSLTMEPDEFLARMLAAGVADLPSAPPPAQQPAAELAQTAPGSGPGPVRHAAAAIADHIANSPHAHSPSVPRHSLRVAPNSDSPGRGPSEDGHAYRPSATRHVCLFLTCMCVFC